jgi:ABC-type dipeptide/oligopeptide/nickel transport system ATPase component
MFHVLTAPEPTLADAAASPLLSIRRLAVAFEGSVGGRAAAVEDASLTVYPMQTVAVVGESGSGKSVTAMSVLRLLPEPPARVVGGRIDFTGPGSQGPVDLARADRKALQTVRGRQIAMIFQEPMTSLNPVFTIGDQIEEAILLHQDVSKHEARARASQSLAEVGIDEPARRLGQYPHEFSGGMRQRVMIAMALACRPALLLADEPTTALDVTIQAQILTLLRELKASRQLGILLITHDLGVVADNADVVCVMYAGRVVEYASVTGLFARPTHPYTRGLLAAIPRLGIRHDRLVTIREVIERDGEFTRLAQSHPGLTPWWPRHTPPADLVAPPAEFAGPAQDSALVEIAPSHWVRVWRTFEARDSVPDSSFRRKLAGNPRAAQFAQVTAP